MIKGHVRPSQHDAPTERDESVTSLLPTISPHLVKSGSSRADGTSTSYEDVVQSPFARFTASPWFPHVVLLCCQLSFASMHITSHMALDYLPPTVYATFRIGMAVPLLFLSAGIQEPSFQTEWGDVPIFVVLGMLGVAIPQTLVFVGNKLAGPAFVGVFTPTVPVYVAILSAILRIERFTVLKGIGVVFAISGAFVLVHIDKLDVHTANTKGILALICLQASFATYLVALQRYLARRPFPFSFFARASACGAAAVAATAIARGDFVHVDWGGVPASAWAALAWAGLGTSFAAHSAVSWAVGRCSAVVPSIYSCMQPVLTTSLAAVYLGQRLTGRDLAAVGAILAGVLLVIYSKVSEDARRRGEKAAEYQLVGRPGKGQNHEEGDGGHVLPFGDGAAAHVTSGGSCSGGGSGGDSAAEVSSSSRQHTEEVRLDIPNTQR